MSDNKALEAALADPVPSINEAPETTVELLQGFYNFETETWETTAYIRELNGEDEEALASITSKKTLSYAEYMSALLSRAVIKIGDVPVEGNASIIDQLIIGDRDLLFIGTVKATYGRVRELEVTCSNCDATNYVSLNLDEDFAIERPKQPLHIPMEVTLRDGSVVKLTYPTGADSLYVAKKAKTTAEQNTLMLSRCAVWDSNPPRDKEQWAKSLNLGDRGKLVKALSTDPPGPKMEEVNTQCANCGEELLIVMDWVSLLFG